MTDILAVLRRGLAGSHEIERELGRGGMARVFLAHERKHDRLVALKVLDPDLAQAIGSERFLREIRLAARLQHPHILTVHDSGEVPGDGHSPALLWFSMPYVEGESLRERLTREGQLPLKAAVAIARESADALAYAHRHGVIHRDIKPENLLLTGGHSLVADFGVARALGDEAQHLTGTGLAIGTPAYMSPEQATGSALDHRSDLYSLGCVLYEMVAGEPPFPGRTPALALSRAMTEPLRPLSSLRDTVPPALDRVVATALSRAPADRFDSAADMSRALEVALGTPAAAPAVVPAAAPARRRMNRTLLAGIGLGVLALVAAVVVAALRGGDSGAVLDPDLVAIAPFDLVSSDEDLEVWSEGIVDVVARYFDGAGTLRALAPTRGIRAWTGRADRESAEQFGRTVGARNVVFGQIVGGQSVRLSATLYDVASGTSLDEHEWRGDAAGLDLLLDSLSTRFLDVLGRTRQVGARRERPFGTSNPLAIREFLSGMREYRRADYEAAAEHMVESVRLDTGFVLGRTYAARMYGWLHRTSHPTRIRLVLEAGERNRGLTPRDSLLVLADSIAGAVHAVRGPPVELYLRLAKLLDQLTHTYPDDPEVLFRVADGNYHYNPLGHDERWHLEQFSRVVELDSLFAPAYQHAIELSAMIEPAEATRSRIARALAVAKPGNERYQALQLSFELLDSTMLPRARQALLDSAPSDEVLRHTLDLLGMSPDTIGLMIARTRARRFAKVGWPGNLVWQLLLHGRLNEAAIVLDSTAFMGSTVRSGPLLDAAELVTVGRMPLVRFDSLYDRYDSTVDTGVGYIFWVGVPLWIAAGDTARIATGLRRFTAQPRVSLAEAELASGFLRAALKLAAGDTSDFRSVAPLGTGVAPGMQAESPLGLFPVEMELAMGREDNAWELLQSRGGLGVISRVRWMLYRARLAEKRGERDIALENYGYIARLWADADEPLRSDAREAREALARLTAERR